MSIVLIFNVLGESETNNEPLLRFFQKNLKKTIWTLIWAILAILANFDRGVVSLGESDESQTPNSSNQHP